MAETRVSQVVAEVLEAGTPFVQVSQVVAEVLESGTPFARVSQVVIEVLRSIDDAPTARRRPNATVM